MRFSLIPTKEQTCFYGLILGEGMYQVKRVCYKNIAMTAMKEYG